MNGFYKKELIISWDCETYKQEVNGETIIKTYLIGWYCEGVFSYSLEPHTDFFNFLLEKAKKFKLSLWAYNANYDLLAFYPLYLSKMVKDHKIDYKISDKQKFISFSYKSHDPDKPLFFKCFDAYTWNPHASLDDCYRLLGLTPKTKIYYEKHNCRYVNNYQFNGFRYVDEHGNPAKVALNIELDYLKIDVEGLFSVVMGQKKIKRQMFDKLGFDPTRTKFLEPKTTPSFSKCLINLATNYNFDSLFRTPVADYEEFRRQYISSCGGFTSHNKKINMCVSPNAQIVSFDVNSMYPAIMVDKIPCGGLCDDSADLIDPVTWYVCEMSECVWNEKYDCIATKPLPARFNSSIFYLLKEYHDILKNKVDWDLKILSVVHQGTTPILSTLLNKLYGLKNQAKIEKKPLLESGTKLIANSFYGKLCEKVYVDETTYDQEELKFRTVATPPVEIWPSTLSGVYVVQKARCVLIDALTKEIDQGNIFLYCDTDSIKMLMHKKPLFNIDNNELGAWKDEGRFTHFRTNGKKKKYLLYKHNKDEDKLRESIGMAFSGVKKKVITSLIVNCPIPLLWEMHNVEKNYIIKGGTVRATKNVFEQKVLMTTDVMTNIGAETCGMYQEKGAGWEFNPL